MLLEVPLVLGRTSEGQAFAMRDSCPHRGIPLSYGRFDGKTLECSYHGWRFEACTGQCVEIPSLTTQDKLKVDRIFAGHYPCQERDGYVWIYMTSPGARTPDPLPAPPKLATFSEKFKITHLSCELPSHIDHGIIGLMDPAHGPFVHSSWFWRSRGSIHPKEKKFEPIPDGFRMSPHSPSSNSLPYQLLKKRTGEPVTTTIDFILPNRRLEEIRSGKLWFCSQTTVTPVRRDLCRIDFVGRMESFFSAVSIFRIVRKNLPPPGSGNHDPASRRAEAQSALDAHRRRRPPREMVFRAQSQSHRVAPHRCSAAPPNSRPRHLTLAIVVNTVPSICHSCVIAWCAIGAWCGSVCVVRDRCAAGKRQGAASAVPQVATINRL